MFGQNLLLRDADGMRNNTLLYLCLHSNRIEGAKRGPTSWIFVAALSKLETSGP